jgi:hypothetical protein
MNKLWHFVRLVPRARFEAACGPASKGDVPDFQASLGENRERLGYEVFALEES